MSLAPQIKDATEAIQHVPSLVDAMIGLLQNPAGWIVLGFFFLWLVLNKKFSHLFDVFERKERRRFEHLDLYVNKPELADAASVKVLRDLRDAHYFKIATGIFAEQKLRSALIGLHDRTSYLVSWNQILKAFPYIVVDDNGGTIIRELTKFEKIGYWYNKIVGYTSFFAAAYILTLFFFSNGKTFTSLAWGIGGSFSVAVFAMFAFAQNLSERAAMRIQKELAKAPIHGGEE